MNNNLELQFKSAVQLYRPNSLRFEDSWNYVLQATRGTPEIYQDEKGFAALTTHDNHLVAVNILGSPKILQDSLYLKNVHPLERSSYSSLGYVPVSEPWSDYAKYDDQTFPQQIIDVKEVLQLKGKPFLELRRELKKAETFTSREYTSSDFSQVEKLLVEQEKRNPGTYESHIMYLDNSAVVFEDQNNSLVGFLVFDEISSLCTAANAYVYNPCAKHFPAYVTYWLCDNVHTPFINMQGSETRSLDFWKRKLHPALSIQNIHMKK